MESTIETTLDMSTTERAHRLAAVAEVLKANKMPQATINMVLAARCGLPMAKVDPKSPYFAWVDEPEQDETEQQGHCSDHLGNAVRSVKDLEANEAAQVLASAFNVMLPGRGTVATIRYHDLIGRG